MYANDIADRSRNAPAQIETENYIYINFQASNYMSPLEEYVWVRFISVSNI